MYKISQGGSSVIFDVDGPVKRSDSDCGSHAEGIRRNPSLPRWCSAAASALYGRVSDLIVVSVLLSKENVECGKNNLLVLVDGSGAYSGVYGESCFNENVFIIYLRKEAAALVVVLGSCAASFSCGIIFVNWKTEDNNANKKGKRRKY